MHKNYRRKIKQSHSRSKRYRSWTTERGLYWSRMRARARERMCHEDYDGIVNRHPKSIAWDYW